MAEELLPHQLLNVHHHIEGAVGPNAADALDLVHAVHHVVAALLERLPHILHRLLGTGQGGRRGFLGDGTGGADAVAQIVADQLGDVGGGGHIADAPAGHGIGLGDTVDQQGALLDLGADGGQADKLLVVIDEVVIDLVGDHIQVILHTHLGDGLQLTAGVHHAGGVGGIVQDHALGFGGDGGSQLFRSDLEVLRLRGLHHHRHAAHHPDQFDVTHPVGSGQDHLVAGIHQRPQGRIDTGLGAAGHGDLRRLIVHAAVLLQPLTYGLTQLHGACGGSVFGIVVLDRLDAGLFDVVGGGEIRLTGAEADHIQAISTHLLKHRIDGQSGGRLNGQCDLGQLFHTQMPPSSFQFTASKIAGFYALTGTNSRSLQYNLRF